MRILARGRKRSRPFRGEVGLLRKGIQMKRLLAFAVIAAIGMFVFGCGASPTQPSAKPDPKVGFGTSSGDKAKTPAAPAKNP